MITLAQDDSLLVLTHAGYEAREAMGLLAQHDLPAQACPHLDELATALDQGVGAVLVDEEALGEECLETLVEALKRQPSWSDLSVIVLTAAGPVGLYDGATERLRSHGTVLLVERPFRPMTLVTTVEEVLRARRRQYQVRTLLQQHESDQAQLRVYAQDLEGRVAERTRQLRETISELEAFAYSVSHDLRGPLRGIQGHVHFLLEEHAEALGASGRRYLERIQSSATHLDRLVRDILIYSRISRSQLVRQRIDLLVLIHQILAENPALQAPRAKIEVRTPLPAVVAHAAPLSQCLSNLLENAVKYVAAGTQPQVTVRAERRGAWVRLWIEDNGIGIAPEHQERIFGMFERVNSGGGYDGSGLGLAIVKKAVQRMEGAVGVRSTLGEGSQFWIDLPAAD